MRRALFLIMVIVLAVAAARAVDSEKLDLGECVERARRTHPAIQAAMHSGESATYDKKAAVANFLPAFKAEYRHTWLDERPTFEIPSQPGMTIPGGTYDVTMNLGAPIGTVTVPVTFPDMTTPPTPAQELPAGDDEMTTVTLSVTQPLFTGGKIWQGYKISKLQEMTAKLQVADAYSQITFQTRKTFYDVLKAREFVQVAKKAVEMGKSLRQRAQDFYDVGMISKNQLLEAEVRLAEFEQNLTQAQTSHDLARTGLGLLIGHDGEDLPVIEGELEYVTFEADLNECIRTGLADRPDVKTARIQAEMADRATKVEYANWMPDVALVGAYSHEKGSFSSDEDSLSLTLGAQWTFWQFGKKYHKIRSASSMAKAAEDNLKMKRDRAKLEIKQAYIRIKQADANLRTARASLNNAEENLRVVRARFRQQMATSFDVLKAQTMLIEAETRVVSALADYMTAKADLDRAMGVINPTEFGAGISLDEIKEGKLPMKKNKKAKANKK